MNPGLVFNLIFAFLIIGALLIIFTIKKPKLTVGLGVCCAAAAGAGMLYLAGTAFTQGTLAFSFNWQAAGFPARLDFHIDGLSAFFVCLVGILTLASAFYSLGYLPCYRGENTARYYFPFLLFAAALFAVVTTADFFYFLIFWEVMTLSSYFLVVYRNREKENLRAGYVYFLTTHISSVGLIIAAVILCKLAGSFGFAESGRALSGLMGTQPWLFHLILALFFIGFGTKAGVFPFGFWMPAAYAAAPASAAAMFSSIMSKMGVYGILRVFLWLLPDLRVEAVTWGLIIAVFGVLSMVVGNLRALGEEDTRRLLAQSSIGQMGYIMLGVGLGLFFLKSAPVLSALALIGALYHVLNHSLFKSLLFFNTGSLYYRTGTRDLNRMGGLIKILPLTAGCALVGSLAISGTPPFNGFVSKWFLYQAAIFGGMRFPLFTLFGIVAIFISTVSLAAYIKYVGSAYLGTVSNQMRSEEEGIPFSMKMVETILAGGCILLGLFPAGPALMLHRILSESVLGSVLPDAGKVLSSLAWGGQGAVSNYIPLVVLAALAVVILISFFVYRLNSVTVAATEVWHCGETLENEEARYRAASFYQPFRNCFPFLYRRLNWPGWKLPEFLGKVWEMDRWLYFPLGKGFLRTCDGVSSTHRGMPQLYLLWQVIGVVLVFVGLYWVMGG